MTTQTQEENLLAQIRQRQRAEERRRTSRMSGTERFLADRPWERIDLDAVERRCREFERQREDREASERNRKIMEEWMASRVGERFLDSRLDNYETPTNGHRAAVEACQKAVDGFGNGDGALLFGDPGGGKTHLLCGMLFEAARLGMSIRYITVEDFYIGLRDAMDGKGSEDKYLESLARPKVLALDDLYCIAAAKSAHEESYQYRMLWALLDRRYQNRRATISSSNRPLADFKEMLDERTRRRLEAKTVSVPKRMKCA